MVRQLFEDERDAAGGQRLRDAVALPSRHWPAACGGAEDDEFALLHGLYWLTADMARRIPAADSGG